MFTVLSFGQVTKVFGLLYSFMFTGLIWSSFFGHLNNPPFALCRQCDIINLFRQLFGAQMSLFFEIGSDINTVDL